MKQYRVAIIGCGAIAGIHLKALQNAGQALCAICDIDRTEAETFSEKYKLSLPIYTDYTELLDEQRPDAVHICTPHHLHAEMCLAALQRDIHVLCEKPLCISYEELDRLLAAEKESHATLGVCMQNRYEPNFRRLKEKAAGGVVGGLGIVSWKRDTAYYRSGDWRGKWSTEGGGVMINQALHTLDLLQWICGMPTHVTSHIENDHLKGIVEVEDTATALLELPCGTPLNFFATTACGADLPAQLQIQLSDGEMMYADSQMLIAAGAVSSQNITAPGDGKRVWGMGHRDLIWDYYRCLSEGEHFPINAREGANVIRLILSMYRSNGKRIAVK